MYPEDVGMLVEEDDSYLILQTHYDNPSLEEGNVDNSGIKLYLTDRPRSMMAGSMVLGDGFVARRGELLKNGFEYAFTCPAECTERMPEKINIFASFQHMHTTGKEIYTNKFGADGEYVENVNKVCVHLLQRICRKTTLSMRTAIKSVLTSMVCLFNRLTFGITTFRIWLSSTHHGHYHPASRCLRPVSTTHPSGRIRASASR